MKPYDDGYAIAISEEVRELLDLESYRKGIFLPKLSAKVYFDRIPQDVFYFHGENSVLLTLTPESLSRALKTRKNLSVFK